MSYLLRSICFLFLVSTFLNTSVSPIQHLCHPEEKDALLAFKTEFGIQKLDFVDFNVSSYPKTRSWVNKSDCCYWDGITCDTKSGKVIGIDLSSSDLHGKLKSNSSLFRLRHIRDLNLAYNNFTASPIPAEFDKLMELERLNLSESSLSGQIPNKLLQLTKLVSLDLSSSSIPLSTDESFLHLLVQNLRNLRELDMSYINISSEIPPEFSNMRYLRLLHLTDCNLFGEFPSSVFLIPSLQSIKLSFNSNLRGNLPVFHENNSLLKLRIDFTAFSGPIPDSISSLKHLTYLTLSFSKFSGKIPSSLGNLSHLSSLYLHSNNFVGEIPSSIGNLNQLTYFLGSKNNFTGVIPRSICGISSLEFLDLSDNNLHGSIPRCLETSMSYLSDLNLRNNRLSGSLPEIFTNAKELISFDVSHNRLEGKLPDSLIGCSALQVLNVGNNRIKDKFPFQLNSLEKLQVLVLRSNKFHGTLHNVDGVWFGFPQLKIIDVSYNDFLDTLPSDYFLNWTVMSSKRDNNMEPEYIRSSSRYYTLVLMIKGVSMEMERILTIYTAIDFSGNQLHGQIPDSIGLLKELRILNLSSNDFTGHIPSSMANLTNLESLDLSQNKISGEIPPELGTLYSLEVINVSHNQLEGSIPQGTQFQRQQCSSYEGNPGLNRPSLKDVCRDIKAPPQHEPLETKEEEEEEEESLSWIAAGLGFGPGVVFGLVMGYIVTSYKHDWFMKTFGRRKQQSTRTR